MARLIPPEPGTRTLSMAERKLFQRFRAELDERWIVLHSVGVASHPKKSWAEIDFVVVGPLGVYCIEVKGGRVRRENGEWIFTRADDTENRKSEGPFEQAGSAEAQLRAFLRGCGGDRGTTGSFIIGWGVMMPDIVFDLSGPDVEPQVLYDARHQSETLLVYLERLSAYWSDRLIAKRRKEPVQPTRSDVDRIADLLRPEFDFRPSLRTRVGVVNDELVRLTEQQMRVVDSRDLNDRLIVLGGAGTGKSLLAVEDARGYGRDEKSVLFVCFNVVLAQWLAEACRDVPTVHVHHLHGLLRELIYQAGLERELPDASEPDLLGLFYPEIAQEALDRLDLVDFFDTLIIDEAQDVLRGAYLDVLELMLRGGLDDGTWRAFYDPKQNLFEGLAADALPRLDSTRPAQFRLSVNCRNTVPIATSTALLSGASIDETLVVEGPEVQHAFYGDGAEQNRLVRLTIDQWLSQGIRPSEIVILSRRRMENSSVRDALGSHWARLVDGRRRPAADSIRFFTTYAFKGLEADAVLLVDVDDLGGPDSMRSIYVGASRARALLAVFLNRDVSDDYERRARELGEHLAAVANPRQES